MNDADGQRCQFCAVRICEHVEVGLTGSGITVAPGRPGYTHRPTPANVRDLMDRLEAGRRLPIDTSRRRFVA